MTPEQKAEALNYPDHFLHDIENMSPEERKSRQAELIAWSKRYATGHANSKWLKFHLFELARLAELTASDAHEAGRRAGLREAREAIQKRMRLLLSQNVTAPNSSELAVYEICIAAILALIGEDR